MGTFPRAVAASGVNPAPRACSAVLFFLRVSCSLEKDKRGPAFCLSLSAFNIRRNWGIQFAWWWTCPSLWGCVCAVGSCWLVALAGWLAATHLVLCRGIGCSTSSDIPLHHPRSILQLLPSSPYHFSPSLI